MMLNRSFPTSRRVAAGMMLVVVVAIGSGVAAWAAQPPSYAVASTMDKPTAGKVISIRENNQPVRDVALRAAALAGMRIADPGVLPADKPVTLDFKRISIDTVMKIIADESGLEYKREGDVVRFVADKKSGQPSSPPAPRGNGEQTGIEGMTRNPRPAYPVDALAGKQNGHVLLRVLVALDGSVEDVRVVESEPAGVFDASSIAAAHQWKFVPRKEGGHSVKGWVDVPIDFESGASAARDAKSQVGQQWRRGYEWAKVDLRGPKTIASMTCDAIRADEDNAPDIAYCGYRR